MLQEVRADAARAWRSSLGRPDGAPAGDEGNAVIGLLSREDRIEPGLEEGLRREKIVGELRFLKHERIGSGEFEPLKHLRQADLERIDIPGGKTELRHGGEESFQTKTSGAIVCHSGSFGEEAPGSVSVQGQSVIFRTLE